MTAQEKTCELSIVIPAYNEGGRIAPTIREIISFAGENRYAYELIVVDDGSTDATFDVVQALNSEMPQLSIVRHPRNLGKGMAVKSGFLAARGETVLFTDADHSTPIDELPKIMTQIHRGYDVVIGSRALPDSIIDEHQPLYRELMGKTFNLLVRILTVHGIHDTQCGFKAFNRESCEPVFRLQRLGGFSFDVEILFIAQKQQLSIVEIPIRWRNNTATHVSTIKDSLRMFRDLFRIRCNQLLGRYKL